MASKSQAQATMMAKAAHDSEYAASRNLSQEVAKDFHKADVDEDNFNQGNCPDCVGGE